MSITTTEMMKQLGIKNAKTLTRWHQAGVIPPPTIGRHPAGLGRMSYWPDWVLQHCRTVKELNKKGQTLNQIAATFGEDWDAVSSRYVPQKKRYSLHAATIAVDRSNVANDVRLMISDFLHVTSSFFSMGYSSDNLLRVPNRIINEGIEMAIEGQNPVLLIYATHVVVVPDFAVSCRLSEDWEDGPPTVVIPLLPIIRGGLRAEKIPDEPAYRPVPKVRKQQDGKAREIGFSLDDQSRVELKGRRVRDA